MFSLNVETTNWSVSVSTKIDFLVSQCCPQSALLIIFTHNSILAACGPWACHLLSDMTSPDSWHISMLSCPLRSPLRAPICSKPVHIFLCHNKTYASSRTIRDICPKNDSGFFLVAVLKQNRPDFRWLCPLFLEIDLFLEEELIVYSYQVKYSFIYTSTLTTFL